MSSRLTLNLGVRYDFVTGVPRSTSRSNPNFVALQAAGRGRPLRRRAGHGSTSARSRRRTATTFSRGRLRLRHARRRHATSSAEAGASTRISATPTRTCCSRQSMPAASGTGQSSRSTTRPASSRQDGTMFHVGNPIATIAGAERGGPSQDSAVRAGGSPRIQQPYTRQANIGWAHQLSASTAVTVDVRPHRRTRPERALPLQLPRPGHRPAPAVRIFDIRPNTQAIRARRSAAARAVYDASFSACAGG